MPIIVGAKLPGVAAAVADAVPLDEKAVAWLVLDIKLPVPFDGLVAAAFALATAEEPVAVCCTLIVDSGCAAGPNEKTGAAAAAPWSAIAGDDGDELEATLVLTETLSPDAKLVASLAFGPLWRTPAVIRSSWALSSRWAAANAAVPPNQTKAAVVAANAPMLLGLMVSTPP